MRKHKVLKSYSLFVGKLQSTTHIHVKNRNETGIHIFVTKWIGSVHVRRCSLVDFVDSSFDKQ